MSAYLQTPTDGDFVILAVAPLFMRDGTDRFPLGSSCFLLAKKYLPAEAGREELTSCLLSS
jgi:hypothetical protein